jgi:hypothetical protein
MKRTMNTQNRVVDALFRALGDLENDIHGNISSQIGGLKPTCTENEDYSSMLYVDKALRKVYLEANPKLDEVQRRVLSSMTRRARCTSSAEFCLPRKEKRAASAAPSYVFQERSALLVQNRVLPSNARCSCSAEFLFSWRRDNAFFSWRRSRYSARCPSSTRFPSSTRCPHSRLASSQYSVLFAAGTHVFFSSSRMAEPFHSPEKTLPPCPPTPGAPVRPPLRAVWGGRASRDLWHQPLSRERMWGRPLRLAELLGEARDTDKTDQ